MRYVASFGRKETAMNEVVLKEKVAEFSDFLRFFLNNFVEKSVKCEL